MIPETVVAYEIGPTWAAYRCPCGDSLDVRHLTNDELLEWLEAHRACTPRPAADPDPAQDGEEKA